MVHEWQVVNAIGDLDGDSLVDLIARHPDGRIELALLNSAGTRRSLTVITGTPTQWVIKGAGDFNGDGRADLFWQSTGWDNSVWLMSGTTRIGNWDIGNNPGFSFLGAGDMDANGSDDVLVGNGTKTAVWEFSPTGVIRGLWGPDQPAGATFGAMALGDMTPDIPRTEYISTFPPRVPSGPTAPYETYQTTGILVGWGAVSGATSYNVSAGPVNGPWSVIASGVTSTSTVLVDEPGGQIREYVVEPQTDCGGSGFISPSAIATPTPPPANAFTFAYSTAGAAFLGWTASTGASDYLLSFQPLGATTWTNVVVHTLSYAIALPIGANYTFRVAARKSGVRSAYTAPITFNIHL